MNGFYWIYLVIIGFLLSNEFIQDKENRRLLFYAACRFLALIFVLQGCVDSHDSLSVYKNPENRAMEMLKRYTHRLHSLILPMYG